MDILHVYHTVKPDNKTSKPLHKFFEKFYDKTKSPVIKNYVYYQKPVKL